mmetsp:Transcript_30390/g.64097  ORF Transcript_30390/g.64097 Transcript_30390/m.64097 type:complete len:653 (+) Transcript_30390:80-2038(+)
MGNVESSSQGSKKDSETNHWHGGNPNADPSLRSLSSMKGGSGPPLALQRKSSSFLDEPVVHKLTERGEARIGVGLRGDPSSADREQRDEADHSDADHKLQYAVSEMQGWRSHMEDKHAINPALCSNPKQLQLLEDHHLFAVFDGHGGDFASYYCGEHFVSTLIAQEEWQRYLRLSSYERGGGNKRGSSAGGGGRESVVGLQLLKSALTSTFLALDAKLMAAQRQRRLAQLSHLESMMYSLSGGGAPGGDDAGDGGDIFRPGTSAHQSVINFSRSLPFANMLPGYSVPLERSGSTGVVVLMTPSHILCANAGDSRAILARKATTTATTTTRTTMTDKASSPCEVLPLSFDHKPNNDVEVCRVERDGGFVRSGRVDGDLAVSRSFGDFGYKNCQRISNNNASCYSSSSSSSTSSSSSSMSSRQAAPGQRPKDNRVTAHPDILVHTREPSRDEFVVLACDGIWDRLTNQACADLIRSLVRDEGETDVGLLCEEVIDTALELDSRDNMTCCIVCFPAADLDRRSDALSSSSSRTKSSLRGVAKRRHERERSWGSDSTPAKRAQVRLDERRRKNREMMAAQKSKMAGGAKGGGGAQSNQRRGGQPTAAAAGAQHGKKHKAPPSNTNIGISRSNSRTKARGSKSLRLQVAGSGAVSSQ